MKIWSYGTCEGSKTAMFFIAEAPWYVFFLDWVVEWMCDHVPGIPLPDKGKILIIDETYTLKHAFGDLSGLFHYYVHDPVFQWCHEKSQIGGIDVDYDTWEARFKERDESRRKAS